MIATDLDDELVLLHQATREMFTLNATGRLIWREIENGRPVESIIEAVTAAFETDTATAESDVAALMTTLARAGLISES